MSNSNLPIPLPNKGAIMLPDGQGVMLPHKPEKNGPPSVPHSQPAIREGLRPRNVIIIAIAVTLVAALIAATVMVGVPTYQDSHTAAASVTRMDSTTLKVTSTSGYNDGIPLRIYVNDNFTATISSDKDGVVYVHDDGSSHVVIKGLARNGADTRVLDTWI